MYDTSEFGRTICCHFTRRFCPFYLFEFSFHQFSEENSTQMFKFIVCECEVIYLMNWLNKTDFRPLKVPKNFECIAPVSKIYVIDEIIS